VLIANNEEILTRVIHISVTPSFDSLYYLNTPGAIFRSSWEWVLHPCQNR